MRWLHAAPCSTHRPSPQQGIFWGILQLSLFVGSTIAAVVITKSDTVSRGTATSLYIALTSLCAAGVSLLLLLRLEKPAKVRASVPS